MRILLAEDSKRLQASLQAGLRRSGFAVDSAEDGETALRYARHNPYDVIVLDVMMPKLDGFGVLRTLRDEGRDTHVLMLTARDGVEDRVRGLQNGADDYLVKPFAFEELLARLHALVRRGYGCKTPVLTVADISINTAARTVSRAGEAVNLTRREYMLLAFLARRAGEVASRHEIEDHLYGERDFPMSNAVDRLVCAVRRKLRDTERPRLIRTRRGVGYILVAPE